MELVVGASKDTMKSLLGKMGNLLAQEYALISGVRGDVQFINDELASMQAFLRDLSSVPEDHSHDHRMKDWMKQIQDIAYDVEDCIDGFAHRLPQDSISHAKCNFLRTKIYVLRTWWPRHSIASNIAALKVRAQQIAERRIRYGVNNPETGNISITTTTRGREDANYIAENQLPSRQIIGIQEPVGMMTDAMKNLDKWLTKNAETPRKEVSVLSIFGFGGIGKTTIAMALYRKIRNEFDYRASVTVSQNYDQDAVLRSILNQVIPTVSNEKQGSSTASLDKKKLAPAIKRALKLVVVPLNRVRGQKRNDGSSGTTQVDIETMDHDRLVKELKSRLAQKRYLILLDDIWSAETWNSIRTCLPEKNKQDSRVIVTTRFRAVGLACSPRDGTDLLHSVAYLSGDDSRKLFDQSVSQLKISKTNDKILQEQQASKEQASKEIPKICGGLPLAIVTLAGLVACNPTKLNGDWSKLSETLFPGPVTSLTLDGVTRILDYCYNDLPADLKTCLLYLSIFPKGWKVRRKRLTRRWMAEGFSTERQGLSEEEVAETYFSQLTRRNIIRPVEHSSNGKVKTFQVHDMILEYIVSKSNEENFITVVGGHWMMPASSNKVRRLSMQSSGSKHGSSTKGLNLAQVRSLTVFGNLNHVPFHSFNNRIIQVLDLEGWKGLTDRHMMEICQMLLLKYLSIRRTEIAKIPSKIEKLEYLETLDIRETFVEELPKSIGQLQRITSILGGNKNTLKGLRLPQEKSKKPVKNPSRQEKSKEPEENPLSQENTEEPEMKSLLSKEKVKRAMKALRVLSGIEIVEESAAVAAGLHQLTGLRKLAIYKLNITTNGDTFKQLRSSIEYLGSCGLQSLSINDENSGFINSLDDMSMPPRYLVTLELSGKLEKPPKWITSINNLNKLTISVTVLRTETFKTLCTLPFLFSLTFAFALSAAKQDQDTLKDILEDNKLESDGEIIISGGGFQSLKLLRFFAPFVPKLSFSDKNAMPALEMIEMWFKDFEGLFSIDILENLREVHLKVSDGADEITKFLVQDLKDNTERPKVFVDGIITA